MIRTHQYFITEKIAKLLEQRIKLKSQLIDILIEVCSIIITNINPIDSNLGTFSVHFNKMGRVFFNFKNSDGIEIRHISFNFPFTIRDGDDGLELYSINSKVKIESEYIAILRTIAAAGGFNERESRHGILLGFSQLVEESIISLGIPEVGYEREIDSIIFELFTFEPGYIRYDFDTEHEDGDLHPLHHLDIFYTQRNTFKLGLRNSINAVTFVDILDTTTNCKYIG